jgi:hypothetical protein
LRCETNYSYSVDEKGRIIIEVGKERGVIAIGSLAQSTAVLLIQ